MKTLSSMGLTPKDQLVLKSLIDLMISRTNEDWTYTDNGEGDVVIVDTENLQNSPEIIREMESRQTIVIEFSAVATANSRLRIQKPLRAANLIAVFNSVETELSDQKGRPEANGTARRESAATPSGQNHRGLLRKILETQNRHSLVIAANGAECIIDLVNDRYQTPGGLTPDDLLRSPSRQVKTSSTSSPAVGSENAWQAAPSIRWKLGLFLSDGMLIESLHSKSRFKLLRWPPSDVPRTFPYVMTLCALLSRKSGATLEEIQREANVSPSDAVALINGAYLANALSIRAFHLEEQPSPSASAERPRGLFDKIRDRLKRKSI